MARATREDWAKRVERWNESGLTAREFGAEIGVPAKSLSFWKWKLGQQEHVAAAPMKTQRAPSRSRARFVELVPKAAAASIGAALEVVLGNGVVVRVPASFDEPALSRLMAVLGGR